MLCIYILFGGFIWYAISTAPRDILTEAYHRDMQDIFVVLSIICFPAILITSFFWPKKWWWWGLILNAPVIVFFSIEVITPNENSLLFFRACGLLAVKLTMVLTVSGFCGKYLSDNKARIKTLFTFKRTIFMAFVFLVYYMATWVYGCPSVKDSFRREMQAKYETAMAKYKDKNDGYPYIKTSICIPFLPGVIFTTESYAFAMLWGEGSWSVCIWIPSKVIRIIRIRTWIS
jgi:hypothetical protein